MLFDFLKEQSANFNWLPEALGVLAAVSLVFKTVRKWIFAAFRAICSFFTSPSKTYKLVNDLTTKLANVEAVSNNSAGKIQNLEDLIGYNGGSGLMDKVGYLLGYQANDFWFRDQPGFICSELGENLDTTHCYCKLLGVTNRTDLNNRNWQGFVDKDQNKGYYEEFLEVAKRRETFRRTIGFKDSNGNDTGVWLVVANPISSDKAKVARYIGLLYPFDPTSKQIAEKYKWPLMPPL